MLYRYTRREWAALWALTVLLACGVAISWPGEKAQIHLESAERRAEAAPASVWGKVDVNRATAEELTALPGIGPSKARGIVAYRQEHGRFGSVEELENVKGIGPVTFRRLREYATTGSDEAQ